MNYYLPRYDLPLVLGYTGPGLSFYSPGSEKTSDLIPSFSKQEDLLAKKQNLGKLKLCEKDDLIDVFFSDKVAMQRVTLELAGVILTGINRIKFFSKKQPQRRTQMDFYVVLILFLTEHASRVYIVTENTNPPSVKMLRLAKKIFKTTTPTISQN